MARLLAILQYDGRVVADHGIETLPELVGWKSLWRRDTTGENDSVVPLISVPVDAGASILDRQAGQMQLVPVTSPALRFYVTPASVPMVSFVVEEDAQAIGSEALRE